MGQQEGTGDGVGGIELGGEGSLFPMARWTGAVNL